VDPKLIVGAALALAVCSGAFAHDEESFGKAVDARKAQKTIRVEMRDSLEFSPSEITVNTGEIVCFQVVNAGKHVHEMVLGTMKGLEEHNELMKAHPHMAHDEPNMVQLAPGKSGMIVWQFTKPGDFYFGCLVEDHYDMGMFGKIRVVPRARPRPPVS
jgi:uncharacterized cupredoxin-like copper-binding protein